MDPEKKPAEAPTPSQTTTTTTTTTKPMAKSNKTLMIVLVVILLLCLCAGAIAAAVYYFSTRAASDLVNNAITTTPSTGTTTNTNPNGSDTNPNSTNNTTGGSTNVNLGNLPANFPTDIPVFAGSEVTGSTSTATETDVLLSAKATPADIHSYYQTALAANGWTVNSDTNVYSVYGISATKGSRTLEVGIADNSSDTTNPTSVITLTAK